MTALTFGRESWGGALGVQIVSHLRDQAQRVERRSRFLRGQIGDSDEKDILGGGVAAPVSYGFRDNGEMDRRVGQFQ